MPKEGYRGWSIGVSPITGTPNLDAVTAYADYWLSGPPAITVSEQGYYSPTTNIKNVMPPEKYAFWYEGKPWVGAEERGIKEGDLRDGGSLETRAANVAYWHQWPDEYDHLMARSGTSSCQRLIRQASNASMARRRPAPGHSSRTGLPEWPTICSFPMSARSIDNGTPAVIDFNLDVDKGEFIAFLGPSGCGKSTTLRMIAGFETISSGDILIKGKRINDLPPEQRPTSMIFQNYALCSRT